MTGVTSNFGTALIGGLVLAIAALFGAGLAWITTRSVGRALEVLGLGSVLVAVCATTLPDTWAGWEGFGDVVWRPGGDTLGRLGEVVRRPDSLAAWLLVGNVLLYVPGLFLLALVWRPRAAFLTGVTASLVAEALQFAALSRVASVDDLILNAAGAGVGVLLALSLRRHAHPKTPPEHRPRIENRKQI